MSIESEFETIRANRRTAAAKACVDLAERIYRTGEEDSSKEARMWVALSLQVDKASADADIEDLKRRAAEKTKTRDIAARAKAAKGGAVLAIAPKDSV